MGERVDDVGLVKRLIYGAFDEVPQRFCLTPAREICQSTKVSSRFSERQDRRKSPHGWLPDRCCFGPLLHVVPQPRDERVPQHLLRGRQVRPCSRQSEFEYAELLLWLVPGDGLCAEMVKSPRRGLDEVCIEENLENGAAFRSDSLGPPFHCDKTRCGICHIVERLSDMSLAVLNHPRDFL